MSQDTQTPIPMRLICPRSDCGELHIDAGEFVTKPHHTHACQYCGEVWRPAIVPTVGVRFLPGFKNPGVIASDVIDLANALRAEGWRLYGRHVPHSPQSGDQPAPLTNARAAIQDLVIADLRPPASAKRTEGGIDLHDLLADEIERRKAKGLATYGTLLQAFNGRDALRDELDETLDAINYSKQRCVETLPKGPSPIRDYPAEHLAAVNDYERNVGHALNLFRQLRGRKEIRK